MTLKWSTNYETTKYEKIKNLKILIFFVLQTRLRHVFVYIYLALKRLIRKNM